MSASAITAERRLERCGNRGVKAIRPQGMPAHYSDGAKKGEGVGATRRAFLELNWPGTRPAGRTASVGDRLTEKARKSRPFIGAPLRLGGAVFRSGMASVLRLCAILAAAVLLTAAPAGAAVRIRIDLAAQRLEAVTPQGETVTWKISSGRRGYETPTGNYGVMRMEADHHSDEYDQAPMPYAIFFSPRGLAIHGSYERGLGRPLSHGCVRLAVPNARQLFQWVEKNGATIEITGAGRAVASEAVERPRGARQPYRPTYRPMYQEPAFQSNFGDFPF